MSGPDWWVTEYERLESEYGYEPSGEQVDQACADRLSSAIDRAHDEAKEGNEE